jgi:hypothetical protein
VNALDPDHCLQPRRAFGSAVAQFTAAGPGSDGTAQRQLQVSDDGGIA